MEPAGLALSSLALLYKNAPEEIATFSTHIDLCRVKIKSCQSAFEADQGHIDDDDKSARLGALEVIKKKLNEAEQGLSKMAKDKGGEFRRKWRVILRHGTLESTIKDLEDWVTRFQPSVFELMKRETSKPGFTQAVEGVASAPESDHPNHEQQPRQALRHSEEITVPGEAIDYQRALEQDGLGDRYMKSLRDFDLEPIPFSTSLVGFSKPHRDVRRGPRFIIERLSIETVTEQDVSSLVFKLGLSKPITSGLLQSKAYMMYTAFPDDNFLDDGYEEFAMIFAVPKVYTEPIRSMRELLLRSSPPKSLSLRLGRARELTRAVVYIHLYNFVHKNISSETVLVLGKKRDDNFGSAVALTGFQFFRVADETTNTSAWGRQGASRMYQHPQRLALDDAGEPVRYRVEHDIYSLGVCLLEIGLWQSCLRYLSNGSVQPNIDLGFGPDMEEEGWPERAKHTLLELCRGRLRQAMGDRYSDVVEACITCLDGDNANSLEPEESSGDQMGGGCAMQLLDDLNDISI